MERKKKNYTPEFKKQALELAIRLGNYSQAARQLGVSDAIIYEWKRKLGYKTPTKGLSETEQENQRLRKENAELKKVNHILKAAAAFFSQDQLK